MAFKDFDIEVQDLKGSQPEHFNGSITTAGSTVTITPTSTNPINFFFLSVPGVRDPDNANAISDAIKYSLDGGTTFDYLMSGESIFLPGVIDDIVLDSNANGTFYRLIVWTAQ